MPGEYCGRRMGIERRGIDPRLETDIVVGVLEPV